MIDCVRCGKAIGSLDFEAMGWAFDPLWAMWFCDKCDLVYQGVHGQDGVVVISSPELTRRLSEADVPVIRAPMEYDIPPMEPDGELK